MKENHGSHVRGKIDQSTIALSRLQQRRGLNSATESISHALTCSELLVAHAPIALTSPIDADRQWFALGSGLPGVKEAPCNQALSSRAQLFLQRIRISLTRCDLALP